MTVQITINDIIDNVPNERNINTKEKEKNEQNEDLKLEIHWF